jgi:uncharacterized protein (DUF111 family)
MGQKQYTPEYEGCRKVAIENNEPLKAVYEAVAQAVANGCFSEETD